MHSHRKAMRAGTEAMGLWVLAGSWAAAEESDGWVPAYVLGRLVGARGDDLAERLVDAGLWHAGEQDGEDGFRFHEWESRQPMRVDLERRRAAQRERMRNARAGAPRAVEPPRPEAKPKAPRKPAADPEGFEAWWAEYPRKTAKAAAAKAYGKALTETGESDPARAAAVVLDGLRNAVQGWRAAQTEARFIPHPATWLNQGRWTDEQPMPGMPDRPQGPSKTAAQCPDWEAHARHEWSDGRNAFVCAGA